jgi:hypothetical protein
MRHIRFAGLTAALAGLAVAVGGAVAVAAIVPATIGVTPSTATAGSTVTFSILCGEPSGSATLAGTVLDLPARIPMTRRDQAAGEWAVSVTLPSTLLPGTYRPSLNCDNGLSDTTTLVVAPGGAPVTGDGTTATAAGGQLAAAGLSLAGLGALLVTVWAWRSRARPGSGG